jgi:hypothetical protein
MTDLQTESERGEQARRILDNPLWAEANAKWEADLSRELRRVASNPEACQQVANLLIAGDKFRAFVEQVAQTGTLANIELNNQQD